MPISTHFIGRSRSVCAIMRVAAGARRGQAALHARDDRLAQRDQRPQAADQHGADAEVADLRAAQDLRRGFGAIGARQALAGAGDGGGELRIVRRGNTRGRAESRC